MKMANILVCNELEQNEYHNLQSNMYAHDTRQPTKFYWSFHQSIELE